MENLLLANYSAISDVFALMFILTFVLWGYIKGFTKTFFSTFGTAIGLLLALLLSSPMANFLQSSFGFVDSVSKGLSGILGNIFGKNVMNMTLGQASAGFLEKAGVSGFIVQIIMSMQTDKSIPRDTTLNGIICHAFAYYIAIIISALILFLLFKLIFWVLGKMMSESKNDNVVKFDKSLGLLMGLFNGIMYLEFVIMLISIIPLSFFQNIYAGIQLSVFANFIEDINLYGLLINNIADTRVIELIKSTIL